MTDEKWEEVKAKIKESFKIISEDTEELPEDDPGQVETIEFNGPIGQMKLERTSKPVVLGEKSMGSKRIGSDKTIVREYSKTEKVHTLKAYKFEPDTDQWIEIEAGDSFKLD